MDTRTYCGFEFVKIGVSKLSDEPILIKYDGKSISWDLMLELIHPDFAQAEQSTYLVFVGDDLKYAGQYSGTFEERWLKKGKYIWHSDNLDYSIRSLLRSEGCPDISVWLSLDPYLIGASGEKPINVNKALEQRIIEEIQPEWNTVGKTRSSKGKRVKDIWSEIKQTELSLDQLKREDDDKRKS